MTLALLDKAAKAVPIVPLPKQRYAAWRKSQDAFTRRWLESTGFECASGTHTLVPGADGALKFVLAGIEEEPNLWSLARLPRELPTGHAYTLEGIRDKKLQEALALGWALGAYRFTRYKKEERAAARLLLPRGANRARVHALAESIMLARDLINTPANDMLPAELADACRAVARAHDAKFKVIVGDELLKANYPTIYTVGKASAQPPRLIELRHGRAGAPKVTLVGKGVCFDSGGLDIKSSANMRLMKKDMGGAAIVLALANAIMALKLDVQLRVLIPAVENAIGGNAMRPLDVVKTRKGLTVEIGNTDAEGRLILCDALAEADSEKPDLIIDCSTLTGAARVALGTDIPAFFTPDEKLAAALDRHSTATSDPLYRLPLWQPYHDMLKSSVADMNNDPDSGYGGAIAAALFLKEFVATTRAWVHIDMMAWNLKASPGRPTGGEAQGLRTLFSLLEERYG